MPCPHGKRRSRCTDCGGSGLSVHGRERTGCSIAAARKDCSIAAAKMHGVASSDLLQRRSRTKRKKGEDEQEQVVVLEGVEVDNKTSHANVHVLSGRLEPYQAQVLNRSGRKVCLGSFATAEEAALCIARSSSGRAAAERAATAARKQVLQQAQVEGLMLRTADNKTGYANVVVSTDGLETYSAEVRHRGKLSYLGRFATAEEAALCAARSPEGQAAAADRAAVEQALQQAQAEGLTLRKAANRSGYAFVSTHAAYPQPKDPKLRGKHRFESYSATVRRSGTSVVLGRFGTAEEAALCIARSPEGKAAAERVAAEPSPPSEPLTREQALQQAEAEGLTLRKTNTKSCTVWKTKQGCPEAADPRLAEARGSLAHGLALRKRPPESQLAGT